MKQNILRQNAEKAVAGLLAVWMSGIVFLFCCEMSTAQALESESCPLSKTSHCDKKSNDETVSQFASFQTENPAIDCCLFPSQVFDKVRKLETNQPTADLAGVIKIQVSKFFFIKREFAFSKNYQSLTFDGTNMHLKNCVFRI